MTPQYAHKPPILDTAHRLGIDLTKRGNRYFGLCPLHAEKTPSFTVSPGIERYHCFGCGADGDAYDLVMAVQGCSFVEAKRFLGVDSELPPRRDKAIKRGFDAWCRAYLSHLVTLRSFYEEIIRDRPVVAIGCGLFHEMPIIEYHIELLLMGTMEEKIELAKDVAKFGEVA